MVVAIVAFSIALPRFYWMAFDKPNRAPFVMYSCIKSDFMIQRNESGVVFMDTKGEIFPREEYEETLPLFYSRQLMVSGIMPDTINGVPMEMHAINMARSFFRARPRDILMPSPGLYPMFESESGRAALEMPKDFFRITWRVEFLDAKENSINEEKSRMFSKVLYDKGFKFPSKTINGLPTTRKSCDEGYLIVDSAGQLFHVKMVKGEPYVRRVDLPVGLTFDYISCVDFRDKKYYAYLFSADNHLYILTQDDYELVKLPVEGVDPLNYEIKIYGDLFHYNIMTAGDDFLKVEVLDSEYKKVDVYNETWPARSQRKEGKIFNFLFPAELKMAINKSSFIGFFPTFNLSFRWIILSLVLIAVQLYLVRRRKAAFPKHFIDLGIIAVTGIFGFLAVNIFQNKFFD